MNIDRIIRFASWFLFFTGFHIYWYDHQKLRYRLAVVGTFYYLVLFVLYLICFCHHYESSELLKTVKDFLPFLYHLIRFQVVVGLVVVINQILESKKLANISNSLIEIFAEDIKSVKKNVDIFEVLVYFMLFGTFLVAITIGLYVAIEVQFALPPLDHIMLCMALFMPHFTLGGCLRLYSLCLWLTKRELDNLRMNFQAVEQNGFPRCSVALEIIIPVVNITDNNEIYRKVSLRLNTLAEFFKLFDPVIQRQLTLLMGLNFNCLLAGVYGYVNYANTWKVLFTARNQRIFHAVNGGIFLCILMDYGILLFSNLSFIEVVSNSKLSVTLLFRLCSLNLFCFCN